MERVPYSAVQRETWQQLCATSPDAWFWHTRDWCDYTAVYQAAAVAADTSFLVVDCGQPVAGCDPGLTARAQACASAPAILVTTFCL